MDIFEKADKQVDPATAPPADNATSPVDGNGADSKDATKAYSERLNADRAKLRSDVQTEMAQSLGYASWEEYRAARRKTVITDAGLEPEKVLPIVDKLLASDPEVLAAKELRDSQAKARSDEQVKAEILTLNSTYGTEYKSMDEIDEAVKALVSKGVPLTKAYGVEHLEELATLTNPPQPTKSHLANVPGVGKSNPPKVVTPEQMTVFRQFNPSATDEQIIAYLNKQ